MKKKIGKKLQLCISLRDKFKMSRLFFPSKTPSNFLPPPSNLLFIELNKRSTRLRPKDEVITRIEKVSISENQKLPDNFKGCKSQKLSSIILNFRLFGKILAFFISKITANRLLFFWDASCFTLSSVQFTPKALVYQCL